jgi:cytochrome c biogenesis protein
MFNSKNLQDIPLQEISIQNGSRFWIGNLFTGEKDRVLLVLEDLTGKCLFYDSEKKFLGETQVGHKVFFSGGEIRVTKIVPATGLQVKADPGVFLVYCGFLALIISVFFSYTSYFQIWAVKRERSVYIYANTNRAVYFFEKHVLDLLVRLEHEGSEVREKYPTLK